MVLVSISLLGVDSSVLFVRLFELLYAFLALVVLPISFDALM